MKEKLVKIECHCGGISGKHYTGDKGCLREVVDRGCRPILAKPAKGDKEPRYRIKDPLLNGGKVFYIGEFQLKDQKLYSQQPNGEWTRAIIQKPLNSLEQLQKNHKELQERCCGLEQQLEEKVKERDNWKDAYNELHKESDEYYEKWIETNGKYLALKDIVDRLIK